MKKSLLPLITSLCAIILIGSTQLVQAALPSKVCVGYWHNWESLRITNIDNRYNVICLSFAEADDDFNQDNNSVNDLEFTPVNSAQLIGDIATVQATGRTVLLSVGGANGSFMLNSTAEKNTFVNTMQSMITTYGVDGIDLDFERQVYMCQTGTISSPSAHIQRLIDGVSELMTWYQTTYSKKMILTCAPEAVYVQGGLSNWSVTNNCGADFLPVLEALNSEFDLIMVQLYNSGSILGLDGNEYFQGTPDFILAATEAVIEGFTSQGGLGTFSGFPASKVVVALPACTGAATGGYVNTTNVKNAVEYLMGISNTRPGSYTRRATHPTLRGLMTWSINNDANPSCGGTYSFAQNYEDIFHVVTGVEEENQTGYSIFPNPTTDQFSIQFSDAVSNGTMNIYDINGNKVHSIVINGLKESIDISHLFSGVYFVEVQGENGSKMVKIVKT